MSLRDHFTSPSPKHERCYTRRAHETKALRGELTAYLTRKTAATTYRPTHVPPTILRRASVHPKDFSTQAWVEGNPNKRKIGKLSP